jgi:hypothetical protein
MKKPRVRSTESSDPTLSPYGCVTTAHACALSGSTRLSAGGFVLVSVKADAVLLMREYFWPRARAALRLIGQTDRHAYARKTLRWIRAHGLEKISIQDVRRDCLSFALDAGKTRELFDRLVDAGWLKPLPIEKTGGRPLERWQVNPHLAKTAGTAQSPLSAIRAVSARPERKRP